MGALVHCRIGRVTVASPSMWERVVVIDES
jgi:hypothetical protein